MYESCSLHTLILFLLDELKKADESVESYPMDAAIDMVNEIKKRIEGNENAKK